MHHRVKKLHYDAGGIVEGGEEDEDITTARRAHGGKPLVGKGDLGPVEKFEREKTVPDLDRRIHRLRGDHVVLEGKRP